MAAPPRPGPALPVHVHDVHRGYGELEVLRGVELQVRPGERVCLIGSNGAGKSTLMSILAGIRRPRRGRATLLGHDPGDPAVKARRGIQLERPHFPYYAKVREIVGLFAAMHPAAVDPAPLYGRFQLRPGAYIRHLSKGQRQRLALLLSTLGEPELLILDEPTSGLDPDAREGLWNAVGRHLRAAPGRALLFTTHELAEAEAWADRVAILHRGRVAATGTPDELCRAHLGCGTKVTVSCDPGGLSAAALAALVPGHLVEHVRHHDDGGVTLYSDHPRQVLEPLPLGETAQIHVGRVCLEDVFFRVMEEEKDDAIAAAQPR